LTLAFSAVLALASSSGAGAAAESPAASAPSAPKDVTLERARGAIAQKDWGGAQAALREGIARDPKNPEYHNLYAYSSRKVANPDMSLVFKHYNEALTLDPKHKGAHEYIGEAYLMVGNVAKAKEHLAQLDKLCFFSCSEFTELKNAISAHESKTVAK
jgi:Tfp pilus assembly protein PilF